MKVGAFSVHRQFLQNSVIQDQELPIHGSETPTTFFVGGRGSRDRYGL